MINTRYTAVKYDYASVTLLTAQTHIGLTMPQITTVFLSSKSLHFFRPIISAVLTRGAQISIFLIRIRSVSTTNYPYPYIFTNRYPYPIHIRCDSFSFTQSIRAWFGSSVRCPAMGADHLLPPECHDNQQWLEDAEFCRAPWKHWVDCKRRTANGREFQSVMVRGKNEYLKTSVWTGNDTNLFSLEALVCRDETERWSVEHSLPESEKSKNFRSMELSHRWNFRSSGANVPRWYSIVGFNVPLDTI